VKTERHNLKESLMLLGGTDFKQLGKVNEHYLRAQADRMGKELTVRAESGTDRAPGRLVWVLALGDSEMTAEMASTR
jgi:hypothetical protein